jgi:DNA-binding NtrC family response regulator
VLTSPATVMVVDDEQRLRESLAELLTGEGYEVTQAGDGDEALALLARPSDPPDVILLDLKMPGRDGLATLADLTADPEQRQIPVVIITSYGGSEQTITAMKAGAYDYITKPFVPDEVLRTAARAVEKRRLSREVERLRAQRGAVDPEPAGLIGRHASMRELFKLIGKVAASDATVLITGESGTGKELVAEAIHRHSRRAARALVTVNCAAIPETLLESELFGHERGAFTGAVQARAGRLELADGGTLFLDEIGDLSLVLQAKLLRAVQERTFERLGGQRTVPSDFRLIAATNRDLTQAMADGRFREASSTVSTWCASRCRRCGRGAATSRSWRNISCPATARSGPTRRRASATRRCVSSCSTSTTATSGNWRTSSNARSSWRRAP